VAPTTRNSPTATPGLDALIELVPVALIHTDRAGECVWANERWCRLTGLSHEEALGYGWLDVLVPLDRERALAYHSSAPHITEVEVRDVFQVHTRAGRMRLVASNIVPLLDDGRALTGHLCACVDITEREQSEQALRALTHEYRERLKELDCQYGISHTVEVSGGSLERILRETTDLLPRSWEYPDITCARIVIYDLDYRTASYRVTPWRQSAPILIQGRSAGYVEVGYLEERPVKDEGPFLAPERRLIDNVAERLGRIAERLITAERLRDQEQQLRERLTHLSRVSTMGEMASSLAHELNQPLTAVATYAQALRRLAVSGSMEEAELLSVLDRIAAEAIRAGNIVHRLKELVRRRETRREPCSVNALISDVEHLAAADARLHDAQLHLELAPELPAVHADGIQIQQVVLNLIRNAVDAMEDTAPPERRVLVSTGLHEGDTVLVAVSDQGCGTLEDQRDLLFQPFFTTKQTGLGVGLSISKSIVTAHGGRMWFTPNPDGRGTTFCFTLPSSGAQHDAE
jgi:PAS domain S-box-containing protein